MQNKKRSAWISVILALAMTITALAGCSSSAPAATSAPAPTKASEATATAAAASAAAPSGDRYGKYESPVEVTLLQTDPIAGSQEVSYDPNKPDRASANANIWITSFKDNLNIDLKRIIAEDATALNATINTSMASGDLPDFMIVPKNLFNVMEKNDVLADFTEAYNSYSSTSGAMVRKAVESIPADTMNACKYDGKWVAVPLTQSYYNCSDVLWARQDWLDTVGMKAPTTIDELQKVASAFKEQKLGGEGTLGLGVCTSNFWMSCGVEDSIIAAYGVVMDTWYKQDDGTYVYSNTLDQMKNGLLKLQEFYKAGLLKSDWAVSDTYDQDIANSKVGLFFAPAWYSVTAVKSNLVNDAKAKWICVPIPSLAGEPVKQGTNASLADVIVANKECKNVDAVFKMIEFELSKYLSPTQEEKAIYFKCDDGYNIWNLRPFRNYGLTGQDFQQSLLYLKSVANNVAVADVDPMISQAYTENVRKIAANGWDGNRETAYDWGIYYVFCVGYPMIQQKITDNMLVAGYNGPSTDNIATYQSTINAALVNSMVKVVMGDDISVFEQGVKTWYATGGQAITDDVNAYYKSQK